MADIELVIKIDEKDYDTIKNLSVYIPSERSGKRFIYLALNSIKNGTPLSEELEKIKAEIECNMGKNNCDLYGYADSLVIIDKEIAELKGEQK